MSIPGLPIWQFRRDVLAEQARDVLALRRKAVIERRGDQHLDDRLFRPTLQARIEIRALHVRKRRRDDDSRRVMRSALLARQASEIGQLRERDVHPERPRAATPLTDALTKCGWQHGGVEQLQEKQLGIEIRDNSRCAKLLA